MCQSESDGTVTGWVCGKPKTIHYTYQGCESALVLGPGESVLDQALPDPGLQVREVGPDPRALPGRRAQEKGEIRTPPLGSRHVTC